MQGICLESALVTEPQTGVCQYIRLILRLYEIPARLVFQKQSIVSNAAMPGHLRS
jgi:hypothetical protein